MLKVTFVVLFRTLGGEEARPRAHVRAGFGRRDGWKASPWGARRLGLRSPTCGLVDQ